MTPKRGWWTCASGRGGGFAVWLACMRHFSTNPPRRSLHFTASSGHQLGHLGLRRYLTTRQNLLKDAPFWVHLGANVASVGGRLLLEADRIERLSVLTQALARHGIPDYDRLPDATRPFGEASDMHGSRGRYLFMLGSNRRFHHPEDRLETSVDIARAARIVDAFTDRMGYCRNA